MGRHSMSWRHPLLRSLFDPAALAVTLLLYAIDVAGGIVVNTRYFETTITGDIIRSACLSGIGFSVMAYLCTLVAYWWADASRRSGPADDQAPITGKLLSMRDPIHMGAALRKRFAPYQLALLALWSPWIMVTWPGGMRDDTIAQFMQTAGYTGYYTQHPLFDTLTFGLFWKFGDATGSLLNGLAAYTITQTLLLSAGAAFALCYLRKIGTPKLLSALALLYFGLSYPLVGGVTMMSKDPFHTIFMLPLAVLIAETCRTRGTALRNPLFAAAFITLTMLAVLSKRTALMILLCAFAVMLITFRGMWKRMLACMLASILLACAVMDPLLASVTHAAHSESRELYGVITQPIGRVQAKNPTAISSDERRLLEGFMDVETAGSQYNPTRTDETFRTLTPHSPLSAKLDALQAWASIGLKDPKNYVKAYAGFSIGWLYTGGEDFTYPYDLAYLFTDDYMTNIWSTFMDGDAGRSQQQRVDAARAALGEFIHAPTIDSKPAWQRVLVDGIGWVANRGSRLLSMGLYVTYVPLALLGWMLSRRQWRMIAAGSLLWFTVLSLYASPISLFWYPISEYFILPLFISMPFLAGKAGES